jgi:hypothetical protein
LTRVADARATLDVERISLAGRGGVSTADFLEDVCRTVAEAFDFDSVVAWRYDPERSTRSSSPASLRSHVRTDGS